MALPSRLLVLALGLPASENPPPLEWRAPSSCPEPRVLVERVGRYLGRALRASDAEQVVGEADVVASNGRYIARFSLRSPSGTTSKTVGTDDCEVLGDLFAIELALAIDPTAAVEHLTAVEHSTDPKTMTRTARVSSLGGVTKAVVLGRPAGPSLGLRLDGGVLFGPVPNLAGGVALALALVYPRWRLETVGRYWFPGPARFDGPSNVGADISLGTVELRGCPAPSLGPVEFPLCVGVELGAMRGDPVGLEQPRVRHRLWLAITAGGGLAWRFHAHMALWIAGDAVVAILRPGFRVEGLGTVHTAAILGARAALGLEWRL